MVVISGVPSVSGTARPRNLTIAVGLPVRLRSAVAPSATTSSGLMSALMLLPPAAAVDLIGIRLLVQPTLAALLEFEMLHRIGDEDFAAVEPRLGDGAVEHAASGADEGPAFQVFFIARLLAYHHHPSARRTFARHHLSRVLIERAARALRFCLCQGSQGTVGDRFGHGCNPK